MDSLRKDLPGAVHTALRKWHTGQQDDSPWLEMLTVSAHLAESPVPNLDLAVKELLLEALDALEPPMSCTRTSAPPSPSWPTSFG
jgi:hypothetical protein